MHTVYTILTVEWYIDIDTSRFIRQLNDRAFRWLNRLDRGANARFEQFSRQLWNHGKFSHCRQVTQEINIGLGQIKPRRTRPKNAYLSLWVLVDDHSGDPLNNLLPHVLILLRRRNILYKVEDFTVQEKENVLDFQCLFWQPRKVLIARWRLVVILLRNGSSV